MALERKWLAIPATPLTADGSTLGIVQVADTIGLRTKMRIGIYSDTAQATDYQVQEVLSKTTFVVGPIGPKVGRGNFSDVSRFLVSENAMFRVAEQDKNNVPEKDHYSAVYEGDPVIADRVKPVDSYGRDYTESNPIPVIDVGGDFSGVLEPHIQNIEALDANTEYQFMFPANTRKFLLRVRDGDSKLQLSWAEGESATNFLTVPAGCNYSEEVNISALRLYFQTSKPNKIIELLFWTQAA